jgi:hypothetical protein
VASGMYEAPCTVIVPCIEGVDDAGPSCAPIIEARAVVDGEARRNRLVTSTRDSSSAETEGWPGVTAVAPRPASRASNGAGAEGSRRSSVLSCPSGYLKRKGNTVLLKMT